MERLRGWGVPAVVGLLTLDLLLGVALLADLL